MICGNIFCDSDGLIGIDNIFFKFDGLRIKYDFHVFFPTTIRFISIQICLLSLKCNKKKLALAGFDPTIPKFTANKF